MSTTSTPKTYSIEDLAAAGHVSSEQFPGVALAFIEMEVELVEPAWSLDCDEEHDHEEPCGYWTADPYDPSEWDRRETGMAVVVMVGDDVRHFVDPSTLAPLDEGEFCAGCGQVGCGW